MDLLWIMTRGRAPANRSRRVAATVSADKVPRAGYASNKYAIEDI